MTVQEVHGQVPSYTASACETGLECPAQWSHLTAWVKASGAATGGDGRGGRGWRGAGAILAGQVGLAGLCDSVHREGLQALCSWL